MRVQKIECNTGSPIGGGRDRQPGLREEQTGPLGVAERPVGPLMPGNAGLGIRFELLGVTLNIIKLPDQGYHLTGAGRDAVDRIVELATRMCPA
jgi:hypothetical protein